MNCKDCKYYFAEVGSESRWMVCNNPKMQVADAYADYKSVPNDGVGYSDSSYEKDLAKLYVGENFGCIHFEKI